MALLGPLPEVSKGHRHGIWRLRPTFLEPEEAVGGRTQVTQTEGNVWILHAQSWEVCLWGLKGIQPQVLRVGLGVWKTPSVAVVLKSLWGLPASKMDSAMGWLVEAGSPATLSSSAVFPRLSNASPSPRCGFFFSL